MRKVAQKRRWLLKEIHDAERWIASQKQSIHVLKSPHYVSELSRLHKLKQRLEKLS